MNKAFKSVYNEASGTFVAVAENVSARGKRSSSSRAMRTILAAGAGLTIAGTSMFAVAQVDGITVAGNDGSSVIEIGQTLKITGGSDTGGSYSAANIKTTMLDGVLSILMAETPHFQGADMGGKTITNVAAGTADSDAVNVSQLNKAAAGARTEVVAGTNVASVDKTQGTDGQDIYTVNAKGASVSAGSSALEVMPSSQADNVTDYAVDLAQATKDDIQKGVDAKDIVDNQGMTFAADGGTPTQRKLGDTIDIVGGDNVTTTASDGEIKVALDKDISLDSVTLSNSGTVAAGDGRAVTGGVVHDAIEDLKDSLNIEGVGIKYFHAMSDKVDSVAAGVDSVAIGPASKAGGTSSIAMGDGAETGEEAEDSTAIGAGSKVMGANSLAIGDGAKVMHQSAAGSQAIGSGAIVSGNVTNALAVGTQAEASASDAVAMGAGSSASEDHATAVGAGASASGEHAIALGAAAATEEGGIAIGNGAKAENAFGIALGEGAGVGTVGDPGGNQHSHIAIGRGAGTDVVGNETIAIGVGAGVGVKDSQHIAIGTGAGTNLQGEMNVSIGYLANQGGGEITHATAVGNQSKAHTEAAAFGSKAKAEEQGTAIGADSQAGKAAVALGKAAEATDNHVAIGQGSRANDSFAQGTGYIVSTAYSNQVVSVGNESVKRRIVNVAAGAQDHDAVNVAQLKGAQKNVADLIGGEITANANGGFDGYVIALKDTDGITHEYKTVAAAINAVSSGEISVLPGNAAILNPDGTLSVVRAVSGGEAVNLDQLNEALAEHAVTYFSVGENSSVANRGNTGAQGRDSMAIGPNVEVVGSESLAIGNNAQVQTDPDTPAEVNRGVAVGADVRVQADRGTVLGNQSRVHDEAGVAIGANAISHGENSLVMGTGARAIEKSGLGATVDNAIAFGTDARTTADDGIAIGHSTRAAGVRSVAQGFAAHALATDSMAFGSNSLANASNAQASGTRAHATGTDSIAAGTDSRASGTRAQASGTGAHAWASDGIAIGTGAKGGFQPDPDDPDLNKRNVDSMAIGNEARAEYERAQAIGFKAEAIGTDALAVGSGAEAKADEAAAFGKGAEASKERALAAGAGARAVAVDASAFGAGAEATVDRSLALGAGAQAGTARSVALGDGAVTAEAVGTSSASVGGITYGGFAGDNPMGTVSVGKEGEKRTITNVAAGRISATSTDAINGSQLYATNVVLGNLATSTANILGGDATLADNGSISMSDIGGTGEDTVHDAIGYAAQGWQLAAEGVTGSETIKPGETATFAAGDNMEVTRDGATVTYSTAKNVAFDSINIGGGTLVVSNNNFTLGANTTVDMGGNRVTKVAPGQDGTDAVNVDQLNQQETTLTNKGLNFAANTGSDVHRNLGETLAIKGAATTSGGYSGANIKTETTNGGINILMAETPHFQGADMGGKTITNVAAGTADSDAVNVSQLNKAAAGARTEVVAGTNVASVDKTQGTDGQDIYTVNAKGASVSAGSSALEVTSSNQADNVTDYAVDLAQATKDDIQKGVDAKDIVDNHGITFAADGGTPTERKLGDTINIAGGDNITTTASDGEIKVALNKDVDLGADGSLTIGDSKLDDGGLVIDDGTSTTTVGAGVINVIGGAGTIAIDGNTGTIGGLSNKTTTYAGFADGTGRAATEEQLKQVSDVASAGWNLAADGVAGSENIGPNDTATFAAGKNMEVDRDGATITYRTAAEVEFDRVDVGDTIIDKEDGITTNKVVVNHGGDAIDVGETLSKGITFAADGGTPTERKLGEQIDIVGDDNITTTASDGEIKIALNKDVDLGADGSLKIGDTTVNNLGVQVGPNVNLGATGLFITGGPSISIDGIHAGDKKITNVAAGAVGPTSTDAINGSQLHAMGESIANFFGDGVTINSDGTLNWDGYFESIFGPDADIKNLAQALEPWNVGAGGGDLAPVLPGDNVDFSGAGGSGGGGGGGGGGAGSGDGNIVVDIDHDGADHNVTFDLADNITVNQSITVGDADGTDPYVTIGDDGNKGGAGSVTFYGEDDGSGSRPSASQSVVAGPGGVGTPQDELDTTRLGYTDESGNQQVLATLNDGLSFGANDGPVHDAPLNTQVDIVGGSGNTDWSKFDSGQNIMTKVTQSEEGIGQIMVALAQDLDVNSVTANEVRINNGPIINENGIDMSGKRITNLAAGVDREDAVNVGQLQDTAANLQGQINSVRGDMHRMDRRLRAGVAAAMATAGLPQAYLPGKSMMAVAGGTWNGESGVAVGYSGISDNGNWVIKLSGNASSRGDYGGTVGVGYQW